MTGGVSDNSPWIGATRDGEPVVGRCEHCEWNAVRPSYAAMTKAYQDHLRKTHPDAWLRA